MGGGRGRRRTDVCSLWTLRQVLLFYGLTLEVGTLCSTALDIFASLRDPYTFVLPPPVPPLPSSRSSPSRAPARPPEDG